MIFSKTDNNLVDLMFRKGDEKARVHFGALTLGLQKIKSQDTSKSFGNYGKRKVAHQVKF